jgi:hypothetical protein
MENKEAINWLTRIRDRLMTTSSKQFEAMTIAIAAIEQQEKDRWRQFRCRKTTEDDCSSFDYIMECELPEDGQEILITVNNNGHEPVQMDTFFGGGGEECALDSGYDLCDEAVAWRPLPEPYQEDKA